MIPMRIAFFDTHRFEKPYFEAANKIRRHEIAFFESRLSPETAHMAETCEAVCVFVNDNVNDVVLDKLEKIGIKIVALRSTGFNHVDLKTARSLGITVVRVPEYSPYAVAEHTLALILCLNRKIHRAYNRVREGNFNLDGLVGFDLYGKTVGIIGTGRIGSHLSKIMSGLGCHVLANDLRVNEGLLSLSNFRYTSFEEILRVSDIISLHIPLTPQTRHLINEAAFSKMKPDAILVNTGRGALIDTKAMVRALKGSQLGGACLDVYEEEEGIFFNDFSDQVLQDDVLARLLTFPNVLLTSHQAFLTRDALANIANTTLQSLSDFEMGGPLLHKVEL